MSPLPRQLDAVRALRREARKRRHRRSRLDRYRAELVALDAQGASWQDLAVWLRKYRRVVVHPTTVGRRLAEWARSASPMAPAGSPEPGR